MTNPGGRACAPRDRGRLDAASAGILSIALGGLLMVLPGFIATEGFPASELRTSPLTRWIVSKPEVVAEAIVAAGPGGAPERYAPRGYWLVAALRIVAPRLIRRITAGGSFTTSTGTPRE